MEKLFSFIISPSPLYFSCAGLDQNFSQNILHTNLIFPLNCILLHFLYLRQEINLIRLSQFKSLKRRSYQLRSHLTTFAYHYLIEPISEILQTLFFLELGRRTGIAYNIIINGVNYFIFQNFHIKRLIIKQRLFGSFVQNPGR